MLKELDTGDGVECEYFFSDLLTDEDIFKM